MNLLGAVLYDPSTAANKATTAAAVMAVLDSTNITLSITVPASGIILVKMKSALDGAATMPQVLLGVMNHSGGAVIGRVVPMAALGGTALATTRVQLWAEFVVTGLAPGALQLDAAFGVELGVASTAIRWGGPNNTTASDAWGAFQFEIWDPKTEPTNFSSLSIDANGRVDVIKVAGTAQTARDLGATLGAAGAGLTAIPTIATVTTLTNLPAITANWLTAAGINAGALNGKGDWNIGKTGYALSAAGVQAIWDALTSALTTVGSIGKLLVDNINATISSRSLHAAADIWAAATRLLTAGTNIVLAKGTGVTGFNDLSAAQVNTEADTALSDVGLTATVTGRIDAAITSRLATAGYTVPPTAAVVADEVATRTLLANVKKVNDVAVAGAGTAGSPWGP